MKHIIIPTDFSPNAQKAADYGMALFDSSDYKITLLHSLYLPIIEAGTAFSRKGVTQRKVDDNFKTEFNRIRSKFPNHKANLGFRFELGDIVNVVEFILESESIFAMVMGTKGSSDSKSNLVGSRTSHMVKAINLPIFVIPEKASTSKIERVLLTTDLELIPFDESLDLVKEICAEHQATIDLLHVNIDNSKQSSVLDIKEKLSQLLEPIDHSFITIEGDDVTNSIWNYLMNCKPDLLISISEKKGFFHRIFQRSVTKELTLHTDLPMLVINGQEYY